jgi:hypothetical protein
MSPIRHGLTAERVAAAADANQNNQARTAKALGCSISTVRHWFHVLGRKPNRRGAPTHPPMRPIVGGGQP